MSKISVLMPVYNAEAYLGESVESVLRQSYDDFELLIIDDGSTDNSVDIIQSYTDSRIRLLQNDHHFINSLNKGLEKSSGKYIARMDADDVMHIDRLRIQHAIMEEEPEITVCGSSMIPFGKEVTPGNISYSGNGLIEYPIIQLLAGNIVFHPTTMIRTGFLREHGLRYEEYSYAEDYKLWFEIAKKGGTFFVESQPLLLYRISENQVTRSKSEEQETTRRKIVREVLNYLIDLNIQEYPEIISVYEKMLLLEKRDLVDFNDISDYFHLFFKRNKNQLIALSRDINKLII